MKRREDRDNQFVHAMWCICLFLTYTQYLGQSPLSHLYLLSAPPPPVYLSVAHPHLSLLCPPTISFHVHLSQSATHSLHSVSPSVRSLCALDRGCCDRRQLVIIQHLLHRALTATPRVAVRPLRAFPRVERHCFVEPHVLGCRDQVKQFGARVGRRRSPGSSAGVCRSVVHCRSLHRH